MSAELVEELEAVEFLNGAENPEHAIPHGLHALSGALAGVAEHGLTFPVDTVKTRMQMAMRPGMPVYGSVHRAMADIVNMEGARHLWRGFGAVMLSAGPAHAAFFSVYEGVKHAMGANEGGHHPGAMALAGVCACVAHDSITLPMDVVKQRMQMFGSAHKYTGVIHTMRRVAAREGMRAFYAAWKPTLLMNAPYTAIHFMVFESCRLVIAPDRRFSVASYLVSGGIAGGVAAALTNPMDVVKTRLQTQGEGGLYYRSAKDCVRRMRIKEGPQAFWRGWSARMMVQAPSAAICWGVYGCLKYFIGGGEDKHVHSHGHGHGHGKKHAHTQGEGKHHGH